jgi:hypothetical protein
MVLLSVIVGMEPVTKSGVTLFKKDRHVRSPAIRPEQADREVISTQC